SYLKIPLSASGYKSNQNQVLRQTESHLFLKKPSYKIQRPAFFVQFFQAIPPFVHGLCLHKYYSSGNYSRYWSADNEEPYHGPGSPGIWLSLSIQNFEKPMLDAPRR